MNDIEQTPIDPTNCKLYNVRIVASRLSEFQEVVIWTTSVFGQGGRHSLWVQGAGEGYPETWARVIDWKAAEEVIESGFPSNFYFKKQNQATAFILRWGHLQVG